MKSNDSKLHHEHATARAKNIATNTLAVLVVLIGTLWLLRDFIASWSEIFSFIGSRF
jgi:hypothetical protein